MNIIHNSIFVSIMLFLWILSLFDGTILSDLLHPYSKAKFQ